MYDLLIDEYVLNINTLFLYPPVLVSYIVVPSLNDLNSLPVISIQFLYLSVKAVV